MTPNKRQTNLLGLSQFEFNNTIVGRLHSKSNLHLDFARNRTNKITFLNKVWYDSAQVIATPPEIKEKQYYLHDVGNMMNCNACIPSKATLPTNCSSLVRIKLRMPTVAATVACLTSSTM